jgi:drug/metabolite transporter (DMT)-like permease
MTVQSRFAAAAAERPLQAGAAIGLFAIVTLGWGTSWPVTKLIVQSVPPLWAVALRSWIAMIAVLAIQLGTRSFIVPKCEDAPAILGVGLLHMVAFATLVAFGLRFVPASQAIVLGYTTPLWAAGGTLQGSGLIVLGAILWAVNIVFLRRHRWIATPFQLLFWQILIAGLVLTAAALAIEGRPSFAWTNRLALLLLYSGVIGTALAY